MMLDVFFLQITIDMNANVKKMCQCPQDSNIFATGGDENDLRLWDLNYPEEPVFRAKNVSYSTNFLHDQFRSKGSNCVCK